MTTYQKQKDRPVEIEPLTTGAKHLWLSERNQNCTECELHKWAKTVCLFGNGAVPAKGMIIGEGPGTTEDAAGRPFVGKSGEYLNGVLYDLELNRDDFYVSNATKCVVPRSVKNDKVMIAATKACAHYLEAELAIVKPKVVLAVGNYAYYHFAHKTGITKSRGKEFFSDKHNCLIVPTIHPAFIMQNPTYHEAFVADVIKFKNILLDVKPPPVDIFLVKTLEDWQQAEKELTEKSDKILTFDLETKGLIDYRDDSQVWCAALTRDGKKSYFIPLEHPESPFLENPDPDWENTWKANYPNVHYRIADEFRPIVEGVCRVILNSRLSNHNVKFDIRHILHFARRYGISTPYDIYL